MAVSVLTMLPVPAHDLVLNRIGSHSANCTAEHRAKLACAKLVAEITPRAATNQRRRQAALAVLAGRGVQVATLLSLRRH
jgi:hypothetical protein